MKSNRDTHDIAIVGMACTFPGADDYEAFWQELVTKKSGISRIPSDRWEWKDCYGDEEVRNSLKYGGFISSIDCFDAEFFGINSREADKMDPQHRLLLETVWKTIEDAGYKTADFDGKSTGVFVGVSTRDYNFLELYEGVDIDAYSSLGMADTILTNRISYLLNLKGPSEPVDTACSSALVAIHRAVQGIRNGECDSAIAGGVHILCHPFHTISFSKAGMLSPEGRCKTFDKGADGYVRGEGVGTILLKPLHQAILDKDHIYGVIRGSFVNHGGKARTITSPNPYAQAKVISAAFERAHITADQISYIEAHGTATPLGDPVEIVALKKALKTLANDQPEKTAYCGLGSVKTNIGHLESAAGIAGIIKVILALKYQQLPALQNFEEINPRIDLSHSPFYLVTENKPWDRLKDKNGAEIPRIAGVSSFGFGGVNAHIVIEEYEDEARVGRRESTEEQTIVLSARNEERLKEYAGRLSTFIRDHQTDLLLQDIAFTLNEGRDLKKETLTISATDKQELMGKLDDYVRGERGRNRETIQKHDYQQARRIALPTYPFEKKRFWFKKKVGNQPPVPLLISPHEIVLERFSEMSVERTIQLREHIVFGLPILPTDSFLELIYQAGKEYFKDPHLQIDHFYIQSGLIAVRNKTTQARIGLARDRLEYQCRIASKIEGVEESFRENVRCQVKPHSEVGRKNADFMDVVGSSEAILDARDIYLENDFPKPAGSFYEPDKVYVGPFFRSIEKIYIKGLRAVSRLILSQSAQAQTTDFGLHPSIVDSLLISAAAFAAWNRKLKSDELFIPFYIEQVIVFREITDTRYWADIQIIKADDKFVGFDLCLMDEQREVVLQIKNLSDLRIQKENIREGFHGLKLDADNNPPLPGKIRLRKKGDDSLEGLIPGQVPGDKDVPPWDGTSRPSRQENGTVPHRVVLKKLVTEPSTRLAGRDGHFKLQLKGILAETLMIDPSRIDDDAGLADLGLDSILGLEFLQKINRNYRINLPGTCLYEHASIRKLGDFIEGLLPVPTSADHRARPDVGPSNSGIMDAMASPQRVFLKKTQEETPGRSADILPPPGAYPPKAVTAEAFLDPSRQYKDELKGILAETLLIDRSRIADEGGFADLGLDSILGLEFLQKINRHFGISLPGTILYEQATVQKLGAYLEGLIPAGIPKAEEHGRAPVVSISQEAPKEVREQDIAIIGIGLRFPGAENTSQLWDILRNNECKMTDVPLSRWDSRKLYQDGAIYCRRGGFISGADQFDAALFGVSPREAELTDPQLRKLLEVVWETLEDGGAIQNIRGSNTGVYIGSCFNDYREVLLESGNRDYQYIGVGNSNSTISNRISYFFDLKGPCLTIDTACSSSLVAIDLAMAALRSKTCDLAIAGGVNINVSPTKYLCFCAMGAFSRKGVINPFDEEADGYLPGEGVATLLLKPLEKAERDKDQIYAVIKATAVNAGGKSSGPTVPNPDQEREVMIRAWQKAGLKRLDYLEAHGTGTKIGDPLEINAIKDAVRQTGISGALHLGTIKANIGHTEAVAGVAGLIKILLQMRNDFIVGQPNLKHLNAMIDLAGTGINIEKEGMAWQKKPNEARIAGVNSFGMGGTYAHVVVEEYEGSGSSHRSECRGDQAFILSARNGERLKEYAGQLARYIGVHKETLSLSDIAYTMQTGRLAMEERVAMLAGSKEELIESLERLVRDTPGEKIVRGNVKQRTEISQWSGNDRAMPESLSQWLVQGDVRKLIEVWVKGVDIEWERLPQNGSARKISLPTYAFSKKRFWVPEGGVSIKTIPPNAIHPLFDSNVSTLAEQKFSKWVRVEELLVKDHLVKGKHIVPGVALLEMARAAGEKAADGAICQIESVVWQRPLEIGEKGREIQILLFPEADRIGFEVVSNDDGSRVLFCHGLLAKGVLETERDDDGRNIPEISAGCSRMLGREELYRFMRSHGIEHGSSFQVVEQIVANDRECLGKISLPENPPGNLSEYVLHPSFMDGALQVCTGLMTLRAVAFLTNSAFLPYSVKELVIRQPVNGPCFSYVRLMEENDCSMTFDVEILDDKGRILVDIRGFEVRSCPGMESHAQAVRMYFSSPWLPRKREPEAAKGRILLINKSSDVQDQLKSLTGQEIDRICDQEDYEEYFTNNRPDYIVYRADHDETELSGVLKLSQCLIKRKIRPAQILFETKSGNISGQALGGFMKTLVQENPGCRGKVLEVDEQASTEKSTEKSAENSAENSTEMWNEILWSELRMAGQRVRFQNGIRYEKEPIEFSRGEGGQIGLAIREGGVYLITGGAGGVGRILSRFLLKKYRARLVLTGRTPAAALDAKSQELLAPGNDVIYVAGDVAKNEDVRRFVSAAKDTFGHINGIIHCAGILRDNLIMNKTPAEAKLVIDPKTKGAKHLDELTRDEKLDFFVLFSSIAGVMGNIGQCDYAYANAWLDEYAAFRDELVRKGLRSGKSLSINWPLWEEGGMQIDPETRRYMHSTLGMEAISSEEGMEIFEDVLRLPPAGMMVVKGIRGKMEQILHPEERKGNPSENGRMDLSEIKAKVEKDARRIVAEILKVREEDIDVDEDMSAFGFDSMTFTELTNRVNETYGLNLSPAVMFEHQTIEKLVEFLLREEKSSLAAKCAPTETTSPRSVDLTQVRPQVEKEAIRLVAGILKVDEGDIDVQEDMSLYGFDSITFTELTNKVNETFGLNLSPAIMFEHKTIRTLVDFLLKENAASFADRNGLAEPRQPAQYDQDKATEHIPRARFSPVPGRPWSHPNDGPVAIIGISGRMPGAGNLEEFWKNLEGMKDSIEEVPGTRWDHRKFKASRWGGFIRDIDTFDRGFFNISPHEAELMDPQQRIFLEEVWKVIADAGYKAKDLSGTKTALYVGVSGMDYMHVLEDNQVGIEAHTSTGVAHSVLANRISYLLNITGPSLAIDTACSSSLIAMKRAVTSIRSGECDLAIAGGVNVLLHPKLYIAFSKAGMLSEDGRCKTFDRTANGYVRGEGVGAVFLKPLAKAEKDGDHIYGIIRGAGENHGGHVSGLTVPNPNAQADVIVEALTEAGVAPDSVSYIEAHGTGTSLGDPIEVNGLKKAFSRLAERDGRKLGEGYCGIGSVKTNIGHLESASGIAGVFKVLLAMKHRKLPGTVHFTEMNPYIQLNQTPFYIVDKTRDWLPPGKMPRIAGVSSFGFGGSNAHIVLEEYDENIRGRRRESPEEQVIILSGKNEERLKEYAGNLASYIKAHKDELLLRDVAFTLRVGREAMPERLGFVARNFDELIGKLDQYWRGEKGGGIICANIRQRGELLKLFEDDAVMQEAMQKWIRHGKITKLMEFWVNGMEISWEAIPRDPETRRINLPAYPFAGQRYWAQGNGGLRRIPSQEAIHPLLDSNESTLGEQRFRKCFSREEYFLRDHLILGKNILPGVAYLEMARSAGMKSTRSKIYQKNQINRINQINQINRIESVVWQQPLRVEDSGEEIDIILHVEGERLGYEILSDKNENRIVFSLGKLSHVELTEKTRDIEGIRGRCAWEMGKAEIYQLFKDHGLEYGPALQVVESIKGNQQECLGELLLPETGAADFDAYELHPGIMDGALQVCLGVMRQASGMYLPFSLRELCIHRKTEKHCFSHVQLKRKSDFSCTYDIDILDANGKLLVSINGLEARRHNTSELRPEASVLFYERRWVEAAGEMERDEESEVESETITETKTETGAGIEAETDAQIQTPTHARTQARARAQARSLLLISQDPKNWDSFPIGANLHFRATLEECEDVLRVNRPKCVMYLVGEDETEIGNVLRLAQAILRNAHQITKLVFVTHAANIAGRAISGFARTMATEHPRVGVKVLALENEKEANNIFRELYRSGREVLWRAGKRFERELMPVAASGSAQLKLKEGGVYLVTGGMGGLGRILARHLVEKYRAKVVVTGRTKEQALHEPLAALRTFGDVLYVEGDMANEADVRRIVSSAKERFGNINGVIHCAGMIKDSLILNKTVAEARQVTGPKIQGTRYLDESTRDENLDFFVLFSSVAAVLGNIGQCDYAFANAYMDEYAVYRHELHLQGQRHGKSLSFNWPLWQQGGMQVDDETRKFLKTTLGMEELTTPEGLQAFENGLTLPLANVMVVKGVGEKIERIIRQTPQKRAAKNIDQKEASRIKSLVEAEARTIVAGILKVKEDELDSHEDFANYGVDSILGMQIITTINNTYAVNLVPSVLLECRTLDSIIEHLLKEFPTELSHKIPQDQKLKNLKESKEANESGEVNEPREPIELSEPRGRQDRKDREDREDRKDRKDCEDRKDRKNRKDCEGRPSPASDAPSALEKVGSAISALPASAIPAPPSRLGRLLYKAFSGVSNLIWDCQVTGRENIPEECAIYCSNHESHLDSFFILMSLPPELRKKFVVMSKKEHFDSWFLRNTGLKMITAIPVDRDGDVLKSIEIGKSVIASGRNLFLHPEGTRTKDGRMNPFKRGAAHIAIEKNVPIVPIRIVGAFDIFPAKMSFPRLFDFGKLRKLKIHIIFGKPLYPSGINAKIVEEIHLTEKLFDTIQSLA